MCYLDSNFQQLVKDQVGERSLGWFMGVNGNIFEKLRFLSREVGSEEQWSKNGILEGVVIQVIKRIRKGDSIEVQSFRKEEVRKVVKKVKFGKCV